MKKQNKKSGNNTQDTIRTGTNKNNKKNTTWPAKNPAGKETYTAKKDTSPPEENPDSQEQRRRIKTGH